MGTVPPRPYSLIPGTEPSITTVFETMLAKKGMAWAAAKETATYMDLHDDWRSWGDGWRINKLMRHHRGVWDGRASVGSLVHRVNQAWIEGVTVDVAEVIEDMASTSAGAKGWKDRTDEVLDLVAPYIDGLERFWEDYRPQKGEAEGIVRVRGCYIGSFDWRTSLYGGDDPHDTLLDIKTTANQVDGKAIYADSWTFQLAALAHADEQVFYGWDEATKKPVEIGTAAWTPPGRCRILHLRGNGRYDLYKVAVPIEAAQHFQAMAYTYQYIRSIPTPEKVVRHAPV